MGATAKRLVEPTMSEVSGVDWPAHLAPGWIVMKEVGDEPLSAEIVAALAADTEGAVMAEVAKTDIPKTDEVKKAEAAAALEAVTKKIEAGETLTVEERLTKAEADIAAANERAEKAEKAEAEAVAKAAGKTPEDLAFEKAVGTLPDEVRKHLSDLAEKVEKAEKAAQVEKDARLSREYLTKAADYAGLPASPETLATTLRAVDEHLDPSVAKEIHRLLGAGAAVVKQSDVLKEWGGEGVTSDAMMGLEAKAAEIQKADPKLTPAQAFTKAMAMNPDLVAAQSQEEGGR